jgi:tetratricopeptide (TPR) repeat protein
MKLFNLSIVLMAIALSSTIGSALAQNDEALVYTKKAVEFEKKGKLEKAIEYHTKAIELSPDNFNYYISRGVVELDLK